jgi:hypothetical protein
MSVKVITKDNFENEVMLEDNNLSQKMRTIHIVKK